MTPDDKTVPEEHWASRDPEGQPSYSAVAGLGRLVLESRLRLGDDATPAAVAGELRTAGVEVTDEQVRAAWDKSGAGYAADANSPSDAS
jgi:hypothetical protein